MKTNYPNLFIFLTILCCFLVSCTSSPKEDQTDTSSLESSLIEEVQSFYLTIPINESMQIDSSMVQKNEFFNDLFKRHNLSSKELYAAAKAFDQVFDVRKIRSDKLYSSVVTVDDTGGSNLNYWYYHHSPFEKFGIHFADSITSFVYKPSVDTVSRTVASSIKKTLYHSILDANLSYEIGLELANVFAWQVDFFKIDSGDFFKIIFDELQIDGEPVGYGRIYASIFGHKGDTFEAYTYNYNNKSQFYDENGNSLKRAFLKAPLKFSRISSRYTKRRYHPVLKRYKAHLGTDYAAPAGTPIRTVGDGVIIAAAYTRGNGRYVKVKHNATYTTQYLHMSRFARGMRNGKKVSQGDIIGYVGSTGLATGPHLCFRFWQNGKQVDPYKVIAPPSDPLPEKEKDIYLNIIKNWKSKLELTQL